MKLIDKVELRPIEEIKPYSNNPKEHPPEQIEKLIKSIKEYGFDQPIVVDEDGIIIKGHARLEASKKIGLEKVPIIKREDLDKMQARGSRIADNKVAESAWDMEMLEVEFEAIDDEFTGFDEDELEFEGDGEVEEDDFVEEVDEEAETITELGDVIELGRHRLVCGDSTSKEDVSKLMNGDKADMVFTDPPYNVNAQSRQNPRGIKNIKNDNMSSENFEKFIDKVFGIIDKVLSANSPAYIFHNYKCQYIFEKLLSKHGFNIRSQIVWFKDIPAYAETLYRQQHELIFYIRRNEEKIKVEKGKDSTVWEIASIQSAKSKDEFGNQWFKGGSKNLNLHVTQKPVKIPSKAINFNTMSNDIILDLFGGSGSTLIAAEQLDRTCYMMELGEYYCDVIIRRYINYRQKENQSVEIKVNGEQIGYSEYLIE